MQEGFDCWGDYLPIFRNDLRGNRICDRDNKSIVDLMPQVWQLQVGVHSWEWIVHYSLLYK